MGACQLGTGGNPQIPFLKWDGLPALHVHPHRGRCPSSSCLVGAVPSQKARCAGLWASRRTRGCLGCFHSLSPWSQAQAFATQDLQATAHRAIACHAPTNPRSLRSSSWTSSRGRVPASEGPRQRPGAFHKHALWPSLWGRQSARAAFSNSLPLCLCVSLSLLYTPAQHAHTHARAGPSGMRLRASLMFTSHPFRCCGCDDTGCMRLQAASHLGYKGQEPCPCHGSPEHTRPSHPHTPPGLHVSQQRPFTRAARTGHWHDCSAAGRT